MDAGAAIEARNNVGATPLTLAAAKSTRPEIVSLLLAKGAEINAKSNGGLTPLMHAARESSSPEIVSLLLDAGADALAKSKEGKKAIDYAQINRNLKGTAAYKDLLQRTWE